jgi:glycosyltransferase involved in cell wall biosynthesis
MLSTCLTSLHGYNAMQTEDHAHGPVRIALLADTLTVGGAEQLLLELLRGLDRKRFAVHLCLLDTSPGIVGDEIIGLGIPCTRGIAPGRFDIRAVPRLQRLFRELRPDIVLLINHRNCLFYGVPAARLARIACIINWQHETWKPYSMHRLTMACRRLLHRAVDIVVAVAHGHADYIAKEEGVARDKITYIYNGVDPERFCSALSREEARTRLGIPPASPVAGISAALRPDKNHENFLRAASLVRRRVPEAHFLIVGDGPRRSALERFGRELGLDDALHWTGFRRDMPDVLRAMDVVCLSSQPRQETFSVAALEAMAAGLPVVCTRVGFMHEMIFDGRNGFLVPIDDSRALADAISALLMDAHTCAAMGRNARALVKSSFTLQHMIHGFEKLFTDAAHPAAKRRPPCAE